MDLTACFGGGLPVLIAGDLNTRHVDWNWRLNTRWAKIVRDYADENSCLIFGQESPNTKPYHPPVSPDVLDIMLTKNISFSVYLTSYFALSLDQLPVFSDISCR